MYNFKIIQILFLQKYSSEIELVITYRLKSIISNMVIKSIVDLHAKKISIIIVFFQ